MNTEVNAKALLKLLNARRLPKFKTLPEVCNFVTAFLMKKYGLYLESHINQGYCFIWAYLVWALWKERLDFVSSDGHVLIYDANKCLYYDASNCEGYETLEDAEVDPNEIADLGIKGMAWYWARCGTYKAEFRRILRATHMKLYKTISKGGLNKLNSDDLYVDEIPYPSFV